MIRVRNLTKTFRQFQAIHSLSFDVHRGETFALLGPNGSGKSTTLKCIAGLTVPDSGEISVSGNDVWKSGCNARKLFSYLPQQISFPESLTAREVMEFYCDLRRIPVDRIEQLLTQSEFDFDGFADRRIGEFSGGMTQRLGLAVACLPNAPLLMLDEPTVSLDPEGARQFRVFLQSMKAAGKTILFSSHLLADVETLADRVAILVEGKLVALRSATELKTELENSSLEDVYIKYIHEHRTKH